MSITDDILAQLQERRRAQGANGIPILDDPFQDFDSLMAGASKLSKNDRELLYFLVEYFFDTAAQNFLTYHRNKNKEVV